MRNEFIENVNDYMKSHKIKKSFLILATDFGKDKIYRIMRGDTEPTYHDMKQIADALNQEISFFLESYAQRKNARKPLDVDTAFFAGEPSATQEELEYIQNLKEFIEHYDALTRVKVY